MKIRHNRIVDIYLAGAFIALTALVYYPGLNSEFILDDFYNLHKLESIESEGYFHYIFSGIASTLGRPVSLATFALQHSHWPESSFLFKLVNLFIHLLNGVLVYTLCRLLGRQLDISTTQVRIFSFLVTALWLLHPMHLSTVLYVVQRMTQLSAFFTLCGICSYLYIRYRYQYEHEIRGLFYNSIVVAVFVILAVLSKENGILLPLFILVIEATILYKLKKSLQWQIWTWCFLALPLVLLAFYLASQLGATLEGYELRPYTLQQRVLTEMVILVNYIRDLVFPHAGAFGLFHDDFPVSQSILDPVTIFSIIGVLLLLIPSIILRKRYPAVSFGILWFFAGHLLESSYLNLELYFEHRNYLPSFGIFFLLGWFFIYVLNVLQRKIIAGTLVSCFYVLILVITGLEMALWSNPGLQAMEWARLHPDSKRALDNLGYHYLINYETDKALEIYEKLGKKYPSEIYPHIVKIKVRYCIEEKQLNNREWQDIYNRAYQAEWHGYATIAELDNLVFSIREGLCRVPEVVNLMRVILILTGNQEYMKVHGALHRLAASLAVHIGDRDAAVANIREAVFLSPKPETIIYKLRILVAAGHYSEAESTLEQFREKYKFDPRVSLAYQNSIERIERAIEDGISPGNN